MSIITRAHQDYRRSTKSLTASNGANFDGWLEEAKEWYRLIAGDQWPQEDWAAMQIDNRPAMTFNRAGVMIDVVSGLEIHNRLEPAFFPRDHANAEIPDTKKAEYLHAVMKWVRDEGDFDQEEHSAFVDLLIAGMGWTLLSMDYAEDPDGLVSKISIDPRRCRWDPACNRKNLKGSKWRMYIMDMSREEVMKRWRKKDLEDAAGPWDSDIDQLYSDRVHRADEAWKYERTQFGTHETLPETVRVCLYQYETLEDVYRIMVDDQSFFLPIKEFNARKEQIEEQNLPYVRQYRKVIKQAHICGNTVLDEDVLTLTGRFTLNCMTGKFDRHNRCFYGLARPMKDPQMWANKFVSSILDIVAASAKGGVMAEESAFLDPKKARQEWNRPDRITFLEHGGIDKVQPKPIAPLPPGLQYLLEYTNAMFPHASGISMEMMGLVSRDQPGVLEYQRKQQGLAILAWAFDAISAYRKEDAKNIIEIVRVHIPEGRLIRIEGNYGQEMVRLIKDEMVKKYDIVVGESPTSPNSKERTWALLGETAPFLVKAGIPIPPHVIKYSPLPEQLKTEWLEYIQQLQQMQGQRQDPVEMARVESEQAKAKKAEADAQLSQAKAAETMVKAQLEPQKVQQAAAKTRVAVSKGEMDVIEKMAAARLKQAQAHKERASGDDILLGRGTNNE